MKNAISKMKKWVKPIFVLSVFLLIVMEFTKLSKEISVEKISEIFLSVSIDRFLAIVVLAIICILPMTRYDFIFNRLVGQNFKKRYIFETSFSINTLNNLLGFGGIINIGLRNHYYGKNLEKKKLVTVTLQAYLYYVVGMSFLSALGVIYVLVNPQSQLHNYLVWFIGAALYFPIMLIISKIKKEVTGNFSKTTQLELSVTSLLEWTGTIILFVFIGYMMGLHFSFLEIFALSLVAHVLGMVSMIPGALGSFDLVSILGLAALGFDHDTAVTWLLIYRISYFIIPFMIGMIYFIKYSGKAFNQENDGVPLKIVKSISNDLVSVLFYLFGAAIILSATIPDAVEKIKWLSSLSQLHANIIFQFPSVLIGYIFILAGRANKSRQKKAFPLSLGLLIVTAIYTNLSGFGILTNLYLIILLALLILSKAQLYREQLLYSWEAITVDLGLALAVTTTYVVIGLNTLGTFHPVHTPAEFLALPFVKNWIRVLLYVLIVSLIIYLIYRCLRGKKKIITKMADLTTIQTMLQNYGGGVTSGLIYLGDKEVYSYENEKGETTCILQCATIGDKIIVMSEPLGKKEDHEKLISQFIEEADRLCYNIVFYEIENEMTMHLHDYGFQFLKFGESAVIDLQNFTLQGHSGKNLRNAVNRIEKDGYSFEVLDGPYSEEFLDTLDAISTKWLRGRNEKGFSLGFFRRDYLNRSSIAVVKNATGEIVAFANLMPVYKAGWCTVDLMRFDVDTSPSGTMDYLFIKLFYYYKEQGEEFFEMGMAPLSNVGTMEQSFFQEKLVYLVYKFGDRFYSFEGLRDYKEKYASHWKPTYTSYSHGSWLLYSIIAVLLVNNRSTKKATPEPKKLEQ